MIPHKRPADQDGSDSNPDGNRHDTIAGHDTGGYVALYPVNVDPVIGDVVSRICRGGRKGGWWRLYHPTYSHIDRWAPAEKALAYQYEMWYHGNVGRGATLPAGGRSPAC